MIYFLLTMLVSMFVLKDGPLYNNDNSLLIYTALYAFLSLISYISITVGNIYRPALIVFIGAALYLLLHDILGFEYVIVFVLCVFIISLMKIVNKYHMTLFCLLLTASFTSFLMDLNGILSYFNVLLMALAVYPLKHAHNGLDEGLAIMISPVIIFDDMMTSFSEKFYEID